jgi:hypothetical protein
MEIGEDEEWKDSIWVGVGQGWDMKRIDYYDIVYN